MNIYEYLLVDGVTGGTIEADKYEIIKIRGVESYYFFREINGIKQKELEIPVVYLWELKCLTCEAA